MFGKKKKDRETAEAQQVGREIAEHVIRYVGKYCDRVVYYRSSQLLMQLAEHLADFPQNAPNDDELNKKKAILVSSFQLHLSDELRPLQDQLTRQVDEMYGDIFKPGGETRPFVMQYIQEQFDERYEGICTASRYMSGLAESHISALLDDPESAET